MSIDAASLEVGHELPQRTVHVDRATLVRYAGASLDFNPIHYDEATATAVGLPNVIAHGMWTMGAAIQTVVDWVGDAGAVTSYSVRFRAPVPVPHDGGVDVVFGGKVTAVSPQEGTAKVELTAVCGPDKVLTKALATVRL